MIIDDSLLFRIATAFMPRINSRIYLPLFEQCGGLDGFFHEKEALITSLEQTYNVRIPSRKEALAKAQEESRFMEKHDVRITHIDDADFPPLLRECPDTPLTLFYRGNLPRPEAPTLAIVGTRRASEFYAAYTEQLIGELASQSKSPVIVSGLAYGIDAAAHRAALKHGLATCAVLGHGLHMIYPATHNTLAQRIVESGGALITEYTSTASVMPANFLKRNRIVAGLCQATLVAESAVKGGAISTARIAASYNRDVAALPGRPNDSMSGGCNMLIKQNIAALAENATDLIQLLNINLSTPAQTSPQLSLPFEDNHDQESAILNLLRMNDKTHIDDLNRILRIPISDLMVILLKMEFEGKVIAYPGKNYTAQ